MVITLAGRAGQSGRSDGSGSAARFLAPLGIAVDRAGNVFVAEFASDVIRKITPEGLVSTLAGSAGAPGSEDGTGDHATSAIPGAWPWIFRGIFMWRTEAISQFAKSLRLAESARSPGFRETRATLMARAATRDSAIPKALRSTRREMFMWPTPQ